MAETDDNSKTVLDEEMKETKKSVAAKTCSSSEEAKTETPSKTGFTETQNKSCAFSVISCP